MSLSSRIASRIYLIHSVLISSLFIYCTNRAEIELSSCFSNGDFYFGIVIRLLLRVCLLWLNVFLLLLFDLRLFVCSCNRNLVCGGEAHTKLSHCMKSTEIDIWINSCYFNIIFSSFLFLFHGLQPGRPCSLRGPQNNWNSLHTWGYWKVHQWC